MQGQETVEAATAYNSRDRREGQRKRNQEEGREKEDQKRSRETQFLGPMKAQGSMNDWNPSSLAGTETLKGSIMRTLGENSLLA